MKTTIPTDNAKTDEYNNGVACFCFLWLIHSPNVSIAIDMQMAVAPSIHRLLASGVLFAKLDILLMQLYNRSMTSFRILNFNPVADSTIAIKAKNMKRGNNGTTIALLIKKVKGNILK